MDPSALDPPEFGRCPCGGAYARRTVEVRVAGKPYPVEQGSCPACGSRVYSAAALCAVEAAIRGRTAPNSPAMP